MKMPNSISHVLPGEKGDDTSWFYRQNPFEQAVIQHQVKFKRQKWPGLENGRFSKLPQHTYPHILPADHERNAFFEPLADEILKYFSDNEIALHSEALNLKSSQVACINFLYPLKNNLKLASEVFQHFFPDIDKITKVEFEYTGPKDGGATPWLGEPPGGKRGQNRTSIDAALFWNDKNQRENATLIEWKFTEHSFGVCSAFQNAIPRDRQACLNMAASVYPDPGSSCLLTAGLYSQDQKYRNRKRHYWQFMDQAGIDLHKFSNLTGCPFQGPLFQIMRQYLLASYLKKFAGFNQVSVISIVFSGNQELMRVPTHLSSLVEKSTDTVVEIWNRTLAEVPPMRHLLVEDLMAVIDHCQGVDPAWRIYLKERYES